MWRQRCFSWRKTLTYIEKLRVEDSDIGVASKDSSEVLLIILNISN